MLADDEQQPNYLEVMDTPTERIAINRLSVDQLDQMLEVIRERRLKTVQVLEKAARVKADEVRLTLFLKFEAQYTRAKRAIERLDALMTRTESVVHKARLLAMAAELEVGEEVYGDDSNQDGTHQGA
jgi:hypothetical protein